MTTLNELMGKTFLGFIFPELRWTELLPGERAGTLVLLKQPGPIPTHTLDFIEKHNVRLGKLLQRYSGGGWTLLHDITFAPDTDFPSRFAAALIMHEVFHLGQSFFTRLSVQGELLAWQTQRLGYQQAFGKNIGDPGEAYPGTRDKWDLLSGLSPDNRQDLAQAKDLMSKISGMYRSDCLPLTPLFNEMWYYLKQGQLGQAFDALKNLITCRS